MKIPERSRRWRAGSGVRGGVTGLVSSRTHLADTVFPHNPHMSLSQPPQAARTTTPSRQSSPKCWAGGARHTGRWSLGFLHLPQQSARGGGRMRRWSADAVEAGCRVSFPDPQPVGRPRKWSDSGLLAALLQGPAEKEPLPHPCLLPHRALQLRLRHPTRSCSRLGPTNTTQRGKGESRQGWREGAGGPRLCTSVDTIHGPASIMQMTSGTSLEG